MQQQQATNQDQQEVYDVAIVGAGPSGSAAAFALAKMGRRVVLLDRYHFPRDKACGDAVMPPALEELQHIGLFSKIEQYQAVTIVASGIAGLPLREERIQGSETIQRGYVIPRMEFDMLLLEHAMDAGANFRAGIFIERIERERYHGDYALVVGYDQLRNAVHLKAKVVLIANGSTSHLNIALREEIMHMGAERSIIRDISLVEEATDRSRLVSRRTYVSTTQAVERLEFYFDMLGQYQYTWIFPVDAARANVGILSTRGQTQGKSKAFTQLLEEFIKNDVSVNNSMFRVPIARAYRSAPINTGLRGTALIGDHTLCIGDAAALADPLSAEGIAEALWSARMAVQVVDDALTKQQYSAEQFIPYALAVRDFCRQQHYEQKLSVSLGTH